MSVGLDTVVRPARPEDVDDVLVIERDSHRTPWSREAFLSEIDVPGRHLDVVAAATPHGQVLAYVSWWTVADEAHVLNVATHPAHRRRGHASRLIAHVLAEAARHGLRQLLLEVRRSNAPALALYRRYGFLEAGVRAHYYASYGEGGGEDALLLVREI